ncbi:MAG: aminopeptidase [Planctomycetota bacterium]
MALGSTIDFIRRVRKFGKRVLNLNFKGSFQQFNPKLQTANWLYASPIHKIKSALKDAEKRRVPFLFSWDRKELDVKDQECKEQGLDTYLFSAEAHGSGDCPITEILLKSEKVRQCYVILHEGWHSTLIEENIKIPYSLEEATGRVVGNFGAIAFAKKEEDNELYKCAIEQERNWARFADFINRWFVKVIELYEKVRLSKKANNHGTRAEMMEEISQARKPLLKKVQKRAEALSTSMSTEWGMKELASPINNAFLLRYYNYTKYYPLAVKTLKDSGGLPAACLRFKCGKTSPRASGKKLDLPNIVMQ